MGRADLAPFINEADFAPFLAWIHGCPDRAITVALINGIPKAHGPRLTHDDLHYPYRYAYPLTCATRPAYQPWWAWILAGATTPPGPPGLAPPARCCQCAGPLPERRQHVWPAWCVNCGVDHDDTQLALF